MSGDNRKACGLSIQGEIFNRLVCLSRLGGNSKPVKVSYSERTVEMDIL